MRLLRQRFVVVANGRPRRILTLRESKHGDVYMQIQTGAVGENIPEDSRVQQFRVSVHSSPNSPEYNTIVSRIEYVSGRVMKSSLLTSVVKSKEGFCPAFELRFSNLQSPAFDIDPATSADAVYLMPYNTRSQTMVMGFVLGARRRLFPFNTEKYTTYQIESTKFRLIFMFTFGEVPALPTMGSFNRLTKPPNGAIDSAEKAFLKDVLRGMTIEGCEKYFQQSFLRLMRKQAQEMIDICSQDPEAVARLTAFRDGIPNLSYFRFTKDNV